MVARSYVQKNLPCFGFGNLATLVVVGWTGTAGATGRTESNGQIGNTGVTGPRGATGLTGVSGRPMLGQLPYSKK